MKSKPPPQRRYRRAVFAAIAVTIAVALGLATHLFLTSKGLSSRLQGETLHLLHVVWGMGLAFTLCAASAWLYLRHRGTGYSGGLIASPEVIDRTEEYRRHGLWLIELRWLAAVLAALLSFLATHVLHILDAALFGPLLELVGLLLAANVLFLRLTKRTRHPYRILILQIVADLLLLTALLHFSGGIENPLYMVYSFHAILTAMLLSRRHSYAVAAFAALLLTGLALGEYFHIFPHRAIRLTPHAPEEAFAHAEAGRAEAVHTEAAAAPHETAAPASDDHLPSEAAAYLHPAHDINFVLGRLLPFDGILICLTYLTRLVVAQLRRRERELMRSLAERKRIEAQLVQAGKLAAIGELAGCFAHEVNNPVAIISGKARLVLERYGSALPGEVRTALEKIDAHAQRIAKITSGLLAFARPSLGRKERLELDVVIDKALELLEDPLRKAGVEVIRRKDPRRPRVCGNESELEQVVFNLVTNAIDAMPRGGKLTVETRIVEPPPRAVLGNGKAAVLLAVSDTGVGMDEKTRRRIFDPFFTTKPQGRGTGLGLSIAHGLVRSHGGRIFARSKPGEGSTFYVFLPESA